MYQLSFKQTLLTIVSLSRYLKITINSLCFHTKVAVFHVLLDPGHQGLEPDVHSGVVHPAALRHVAPAAASQAQHDVSAWMLVT